MNTRRMRRRTNQQKKKTNRPGVLCEKYCGDLNSFKRRNDENDYDNDEDNEGDSNDFSCL